MTTTDPPGSDMPEGNAIARGLVDAFHKVSSAHVEAKKAHLTDVLDTIEADLAPHIAAATEAARNHPDTPEWVRELFETMSNPPHFSTAFLIGIAAAGVLQPVLAAVLAPTVQALSNTTWHGAATTPGNPATIRPSPDLLAAAVLKGVLTEGPAAGIAAFSGTNAADFNVMVNTAGQSLGLAEALLLERRNQLVGVTLDEILQYSNMNPRFYASAANLKYVPPSVGEVLTGVLKHHLDPALGPTMIGHAGIDPAHFPWLLASSGRPPGTMEMLDLWNKSAAGLITTTVDEAVVDAAIEQSDINDTFLPYVKELRHYFPPPRSVVPMLRAGAVTPAQASQLLDGYGVGEPWKSAFIAEGQHHSGIAVKQLSQAQIVANYENRLMDRTTALARLEALTYSTADANALLDLADEKRAERLRNALVGMVGRRYVNYKITKADASHALAGGAIPNAAQLDLFTIWDLERQANVHVPTPASVVGAFRRGILTALETKQRLLQGGTVIGDIAIIVGDGYPPTHPGAAQAAAAAVVNA